MFTYVCGGVEISYKIGDVVRTKKAHPCGANEWEITRVRIRF